MKKATHILFTMPNGYQPFIQNICLLYVKELRNLPQMILFRKNRNFKPWHSIERAHYLFWLPEDWFIHQNGKFAPNLIADLI